MSMEDATPTRSVVGSPHLPGLDGLRALSVLAVVAFHSGLIDGGWVGVDVFFAISGFLITGLIVAERERTGTVDLTAFWRRRFRRLVPALLVLLGLVALLALIDQVDVEARNVWGALTYTTNWVHIVGGASYWDAFAAPDPLRHLWSLAIEEQFYVVWPVVAWFALRHRSARVLSRVALVLAGMSAAVQMIGTASGLSIDRVYQGTDTRAVAFLLGAALACRGWPPPVVRTRTLVRLLPVVGYCGFVAASLWLPGDRRWVFGGPLIGMSVVGVALVVHSATKSDRLLDSRILRAVGRWSYGIYLFHWPLVVCDVGEEWSAIVRFIVVSVISVALAAISYRFVEMPIRRGGVSRRALVPAAIVSTSIVVGALATTESAAPAIDTSVTLAPSSEPITRPRVMVFGDSVPAVAADEIGVVAESMGIDVDVYADPGCVPSEDLRDQYGKSECLTFLREVRARAERLDIDTVVVWWGGTGSWFSWQGIEQRFCAPESQSAVRERIENLIGYFIGVADVVLVAPVPRTDLGPDGAAGTRCDEEAHDTIGRERGIAVVKLSEWVCPEYPDDCERIVRYDGLHYDGESAREVARIILQAVPGHP